MMGIPVAMYIYGVLYGNSTMNKNSNQFKSMESQKELSEKFKILPKTSAVTALTVLNVIYLIYFIGQLAYFTSAFSNILPEGFTYAEYARRGFFQICQISVINLFIIGIISSFAKKNEDKLVRVEIAILSLFAILFSATVISKMVMYIKIYGMTQLRIYTTWFTVLLGIIFTIILLRQFISFNGFKTAVIGFIICFVVLCYGNIDGNIAKYNLQRYEAGTLELMDETVMYQLNDGAVPYLYEAYKSTDNQLDKEILYNGITFHTRLDEYGLEENETKDDFHWKNINIQKQMTNDIAKNL